jgi:hypothetical protein
MVVFFFFYQPLNRFLDCTPPENPKPFEKLAQFLVGHYSQEQMPWDHTGENSNPRFTLHSA